MVQQGLYRKDYPLDKLKILTVMSRIIYKVERNCGRYAVVRLDKLKGTGCVVCECRSLEEAKKICKKKNDKLKWEI